MARRSEIDMTDALGSGPVIDVQVGLQKAAVADLVTKGLPVPPTVAIRMQVDTGATNCVLVPSVIKALALQPVSRGTASSPNAHNVPVLMYAVTLYTPVGSFEETVMAVVLPGQNIQGLIGRTLLQAGCFTYDGKKSSFVLEF